MNQIDLLVNQQAIVLQTPILNKIMIFITNIGSPELMTALSAVLVVVLFFCKKKHHALFLIYSMGAGVILTLLIKLIAQRERPENAIIYAAGYSFPSGHATASIIFFSLLIYAFKDDIKNKLLKNLFIAANTTLFILIGFSRIYLNVHWLTDVVAGYALGLLVLTAFFRFFPRIK
ncbi:MAG: phosphatase PAP2 family protein [Candidatus Aenigmarchaeota archaeon]|nr:phosphatase PAP2 family protein [Candidatus Aenigmarchaeota archaeon]